jgi:hypothetical protein
LFLLQNKNDGVALDEVIFETGVGNPVEHRCVTHLYGIPLMSFIEAEIMGEWF